MIKAFILAAHLYTLPPCTPFLTNNCYYEAEFREGVVSEIVTIDNNVFWLRLQEYPS